MLWMKAYAGGGCPAIPAGEEGLPEGTTGPDWEYMMRRILTMILVIAFCLSSPVSGQINDESVQEGNVEQLPMKRPFVEYAIASGFLVAAIAIGFKTSKRTND